MNWTAHLSSDPAVCHGKACIKGTRIMAAVVLDNLASGISVSDLVRLYPALSEADVFAAMAYGAALAREESLPLAA